MQNTNRRLMLHGMLLFLLGLLIGLAEQRFANLRMALAAHLEGVMNGIFLIALGTAWGQVTLPAKAKAFAYRAVLYGTYGNCVVTALAAAFGTATLSPLTGAGHKGRPWQEVLVTAGFISVGVAMLLASVTLLWGLRTKGNRTVRGD